MTAATRVGWCPGALRPMPSGDGLLVRVKPHCATLSLDQAAGLAALAARCGNGQIDLTGRANLQIRGVTEETLGALTAGLDRLGLLDPDREAEAVRNIVASPLAGLDPEACADIRPIAAALEARLASDPACRRLPSKWNMVVDDGGALNLGDVTADLRFVCGPGGSVSVGVGDAWAAVAADHVADALSAIAALVAEHRPERMRNLVESLGAAAILRAAGLRQTGLRPIGRATVSAEHLLGTGETCVGVAPPFGSLGAPELLGLVEAARRAHAHDLRLTPWRMLLVTTPVPARRRSRRVDPGCAADLDGFAVFAMTGKGATRGSFPQLEADLASLGFIVAAADPRLDIVACVGAPACHRATVWTRADAARLAGIMASAATVHVSGCAKGCARPAAAPWTLVGRDGRYDLVRDGTAGDGPVARGLSFDAAAAWVAARVDAPPGPR